MSRARLLRYARNDVGGSGGLIRAVALLMAVVLVAGGCMLRLNTGRPKATSTTTTSAASPIPGLGSTMTWENCGTHLQCTKLQVPLDHAKPEGPKITLSLNRRPAKTPNKRIGSMLVNPGGPGGSGLDLVEQSSDELDGLNSRFDLVGWDPRGVGESTPVKCETHLDKFFAANPDTTNPAELQNFFDQTDAFVKSCTDNTSSDLLAHISTEDSVNDMDSILTALGENKMNFYGFSYGSQLGALFIEKYPDRVRAFTLDGGYDPTLDAVAGARQQAVGFEQALNSFLDNCAKRKNCPLKVDGKVDPTRYFDTLHQQVKDKPLRGTSDYKGRSMGAADFLTAVDSALYDKTDGWPALEQALADAGKDGDPSGLFDLFDQYTGRASDGTYEGSSIPAGVAIGCLDSPVPKDKVDYNKLADDFAKEAPRQGRSLAWANWVCAKWPKPPTNAARQLSPAAAGAPPILLLGNTGDPATPYEASLKLASQLPSSVLVTYEGEGHLSSGKSSCVDDIVRKYFYDLVVPPKGTVCK